MNSNVWGKSGESLLLLHHDVRTDFELQPNKDGTFCLALSSPSFFLTVSQTAKAWFVKPR
ncbi:MAG: hypothetical protein WAV01_00040 [Candidatus Saccharimonadales bacterium]